MTKCPIPNGCSDFCNGKCNRDGEVNIKGKGGIPEKSKCKTYPLLLDLVNVLGTYNIDVRKLENETYYN